MYVIGTAGHVDHGKSTLVEALTGTHPDRLKEERERQMTIDLGFAWLRLGEGEEVGVVDVPGHRDFIENMLAGVGGIDAALLVVAADEGVMPQTREHLAILDLLQVSAGVVVLTKADLVDADWLDLVMVDVAGVVEGTALAGAPIVAVSARTGAGLDRLRGELAAVLAARPPRVDLGRPRLPVDRVFSLAGFGTIVTGTLAGGTLAAGEEVVLLPDHIPARVRGLQTHKTKIERALPGSRVAANLAGVDLEQVRRGMVVARPGTFVPTTMLDARLRHLPDSGQPLKHNTEVKFFVGAAEVVGHVRLLESAGAQALAPGASAWVQITLAGPVVVGKGDRFILRRPSPGNTIGGGEVIDPHPKRRHRRRDPAVINRLETLARGTPGELLAQALDNLGPAPVREAVARAGLDRTGGLEAAAEARAAGLLVELDGEQLAVSRGVWGRLEAALIAALGAYHAAHPLRLGMPREELKSRVTQSVDPQWRARLTPKVFNVILARAGQEGWLAPNGAGLRLARHTVVLTPAQQALADTLLADFGRDPHNTPSHKDAQARLGDELLAALLEQGTLVAASPEVLFDAATYRQMVERVREHLQARGKITVAEVRDLFSTSRKYALALMEHLDALGVTRRVGDERVLKNP
jgi:selenocysteine-specific elongation factor